MRKIFAFAVAVVSAAAVWAGILAVPAVAGNGHDPDKGAFEFKEGTLVLSRSVYAGDENTVTVGQTLPPGCVPGTVTIANTTPPGGTTAVSISAKSSGCPAGGAVANGVYPGVWNNANADGSFGVTSPIFLDNLDPYGKLLGTLSIPDNVLVTSFSSKSELALNLALDGKSITFVAYQGGPGCKPGAVTESNGTIVTPFGGAAEILSPTAPNLLDVSNSNTPGVCDPSNPVVASSAGATGGTAYYRAVGEVDSRGNLTVSDGNAYSGNNGRAAIKANWIYYLVGNNNNGGLSTAQLTGTVVGQDLVSSTGSELLIPGVFPPSPPDINMMGDFSVMQYGFTADKPGKDNNFRGLTIHGNTLYVTKGSGGNGINTVYQVGQPGELPNGTTAQLESEPITILPGFSTVEASATSGVAYPFGIWFANDTTLYVCDEGDGTLVTPAMNGNVATMAAQTTAGVQKWVLEGDGQWHLLYFLNKGLNIGVPYSVPNYPSALNPATDGCRNLTGKVSPDGLVTLYAVTSTVSANGDQGADPNLLVTVSDWLNSTTLPTHGFTGKFSVVRSAQFGEVFRGITWAPTDRGR